MSAESNNRSSATDLATLQARLASADLTPARLHSLARHAADSVLRIETMLANFYERVRLQPGLDELLAAPGTLPRLMAAQRTYARELFAPTIDAAYVEGRHRIGEAHHRVRLTPQWYLSAYALLTEDLVVWLLERGAVEDAWTMLQRILFDASLALDAYGMCSERELRGNAATAASPEAIGKAPAAANVPAQGQAPAVARVRLTMEQASKRREFLGLDDVAMTELRQAAPLLLAAVPAVLQDFYRFFSSQPATARLVPEAVVARLQEQVASYWHELVHGSFDRPYAASRMRIGLVHERIGLSSQWYLGGLGRQLHGLLRTFWTQRPGATAAVRAVLRAAFFDMTFVIDAYMEARAEAVLRTEGYAARLVASLTAGVAVLDRGHRVISANRSLLEMIGIDAGLVQHLPITDLLPRIAMEELLGGLGAETAARANTTTSLGTRRLRITALRLDGREDVSRIAIVVDDVTDLQLMARAIDHDAAELGALVDAAPDVLWAAELPTWTVLSISRQVLPLTGYRDVALVGRADAWLRLLPEPERTLLRERAAALQPGQTDELQHRLQHADGGLVFVQTRLRRVADRDGRAVVVATTTDITRLRDEGERRLREVGQLAGGVAHEINNALTAAMGELQLLDLDGLRPELDDCRSRSLRACERAAQVTHQLLAFAQRQVLRPERLGLGAWLQRLRPKLANVLGNRHRLELRVEPTPLPCSLDPDAFEGCVMQLVANAREALGDAGHLLVDCRRLDEDRLEIVLQDDGHGMTADVAARACEPFFTTRAGQGAGLGLPMVQGFIAQSGGELRLTSELGRGTTVRMRLPLARTVATPPAADGPRQRPCLLVVEDDAMVREIVVRAATGVGFRTLAVATARQALDLIEAATIDAVFADIMLGPGMDGLALARHLRGQRPELPLALTSGYLPAQLANDDELRGHPFLAKPFTLPALRAVLAAMLAQGARHTRGPLAP